MTDAAKSKDPALPGTAPVRPTRFRAGVKLSLLVLPGAVVAAVIFLTSSWSWAGQVVIVGLIVALVLKEVLAELEGPTNRQVRKVLNALILPLLVLWACEVVNKIINILTIPDF